ncbi:MULTISPECIES: ABC transporter permease [unclassified Paenibacillus]|uniref:ABC transporter permease n=1 Tax=unclassified Paenibacillus TaxID=185978 RepID=UPI001AE2A6D2|nr:MULTISPECIES: ABC transporter permease [unclassified Paenibacillus]MBP1156463.1 peptide/nickel transport system permease protein [Paenibacillus sp. PvP091]MBP1168151.1 peptide/nickel transport system permease protein [Paenibacillus sp. PvR098]MBP2439179.1 peptide/nickel transport system permease protein [Paenibacillus sp. PvP052]
MILRYSIQRLVQMVPTVILITIIVFMLMHLIPGDPVAVMLGYTEEGSSAAFSQEVYKEMQVKLGFDQPIYIQYLDWLINVAKGDLGSSFVSGQPVSDIIVSRIPATFYLALSSLLLAVLISIPAAIFAATRQNSLADYTVMGFSLLGVCIPSFWLALLLILLFAVNLGWFPALGYVSPQDGFNEFLKALILPTIVLGTATAAKVVRFMRSDVIEQLQQDYVRTARAKGLPQQLILWRHVLKNSFITTSTVLAFEIGYLLGGSTVIETVFAWPGVSYLLLQSIYQRDFPVVQGVVLLLALTVVIVNYVVDIIYHLLDPRIKLNG